MKKKLRGIVAILIAVMSLSMVAPTAVFADEITTNVQISENETETLLDEETESVEIIDDADADAEVDETEVINADEMEALDVTETPSEEVKTSDDEKQTTSNEESTKEEMSKTLDTSTTWDGTSTSTSWSGSGTSDSPYLITSAAELAGLASSVNSGTNYSGKYFKLTTDIDLNNKSWTPIGTSASYYFAGSFDGDGHRISNLYISASTYYQALFGFVRSYDSSTVAELKNFVVDGNVTNANKYTAGVLAYGSYSVTIQNVGNEVNVTSTGASSSNGGYVGGVVGYLQTMSGSYKAVIDSCYNKGAITTSYNKTGGVAGYIYNISGATFAFTNNYNAGVVTSNMSNGSYNMPGGIIGYVQAGASYKITLSNNMNIGPVYWTSGSYNPGAIAGKCTSSYINSSNNYYLTNVYYKGGTASTGYAIGDNTTNTTGFTTFTAANGLKASSLGSAFNDGNTYKISVGGVETDVTVPVLSWEGTFYAVKFDCEHATSSLGASTSVKEGNTAEFTVTLDDGYKDPVVKIGSSVLTPDNNGVYTIPAVMNELTVTITATACKHDGTVTFVEAKEPDCTNAGNKEYYKCEECGQCFKEETLETPFTAEDSYVIPANGHSWDSTGKCTVCGTENVWDGKSVSEPKLDEDGKTYLISDAKELAWFRDKLNDTSGTTYNLRLTSDIFLSNKSWTPIALNSTETPWTGNFYGDGYTIHGLNCNYEGTNSSGCYAGLIGQYNGTLIENLNVEGTVKYSYSYSNSATGGIVGYADKTGCVINNCTFTGTVNSDSYGGGIVGRGTTGTKIINCGVVGTIKSTKSTSSYAGGIVGKTGPNSGNATRGYVANCYFKGTVSGALNNYGLGYAGYSIDYDNCYTNCGSTWPGTAVTADTKATATNLYSTVQNAATMNDCTSTTKTTLEGLGYKYNTWYNHADGADFTKIICNHESLTEHKANKKTCTKDGNLQYWSCDKCETLFLDAEATEETTLKAVTIKAGHEYKEEIIKEATCADGLKKFTCSECKDSYTQVIAGTGNHSYKGYDNGDGTHTNKCTVCEQLKPTGYAVVKTATTLEAGKSYVIVETNDSDNYAMAVGAGSYNMGRTGIKFDSSNISDDIVWKCEEGGYLKNGSNYLTGGSSIQINLGTDKSSAITWEISGKNMKATNSSTYNTLAYNNANNFLYFALVYSTNTSLHATVNVYEVEATTGTEAHTYDNGKVKTAATCTEEGVMLYTCTACGVTKEEVIEAKGHSYTDGFCTACDGLDPDAVTYKVTKANQLVKVSESAAAGNTFAGKSILLSKDIDLSTVENWKPIGGNATKTTLTLTSQADLEAALEEHYMIYDNTGASYVKGSDKNGKYDSARTYYYQTGSAFEGTFDGQNYSITNMRVNTTTGYAGFLGLVTGTVKNLTISGSVVSTTDQDYIGAIAGKLGAGGTIENCTSRVNVIANSAYNVGGIVGAVGEFGEFVSDTNPMATVSNCVNNGYVSGNVRVGGIAGRNAGTVKSCANHGTIFNKSGKKKGTGGIVGMNGVNQKTPTDAGIVSGCYNDGYVDGNKGFWTGGIVGFQSAKSTTEYSYNAGLIRVGEDETSDSKYNWCNPVVGQNEGTVNACLWLNKNSGNAVKDYVGYDATGVGNSGGKVTDVKGLTEGELIGTAAVDALNAGDTTYFQIDCGNYPALMYETATAHISVTDKAVEPTCEETGLTEGSHCSVCYTVLKAQEVVKANGHTEAEDAAVEATCSSTGLTKGSHCSVCGKVLTKQQVIDKLAHTVETTGVVQATCSKEGYTGDAVCKVCHTVILKGAVISKRAHVTAVDKAVAAAYNKTGLTEGSHCSVCGTTLKAQEVIPAVEGWKQLDGNWYYYKDAEPVKGWVTVGANKYYTDIQTGILVTGLKKVNGKWYYFAPADGKMLTGLQKINGYWRYFDLADGRMLTGLQKVNGYWRYFDTTYGRMLTGLQKVNGYWRYFDTTNGRMLTGLQKVNGYWRYFDTTYGRMLTGWQKINGRTYYFDTTYGRALIGKQTINGKTYTFKADGSLVTK